MIVRPRLVVALAVTGLALAGCASSGTPAASGSQAPASVSGAAQKYAGVNLATPYRRPTFTLTDQGGQPFDFKAVTAGVPTLLYFGYTRCPDVCPTTMSDLAQALNQTSATARATTRVAFITTDPAHDTPPVLKSWVGHYNPAFVGLTADTAATRAAAVAMGIPILDPQTHGTATMAFRNGTSSVVWLSGTPVSDYAHDLALLAK